MLTSLEFSCSINCANSEGQVRSISVLLKLKVQMRWQKLPKDTYLQILPRIPPGLCEYSKSGIVLK